MAHEKAFTVCASLLLMLTSSAQASSSDLCIVAQFETGNPEAVGASEAGTRGMAEIVYSTREGSAWSASTVLSSDAASGAKPVLAFDSRGNRLVVWGNADTIGRIVLRTLPASGGVWSEEVIVSDTSEPSQHPWVVGFGDDVYVVYEVAGTPGTWI